MTKATIKKIQKHIDDNYPAELDINFYKGGGYFYFCGQTYLAQSIESFYVCYLYEMSLEEWIKLIDERILEAVENDFGDTVEIVDGVIQLVRK